MKKVLAFLSLVVLLSLAVAACAPTEVPTEAPTEAATPEPTEEVTEAPTPEATEEPTTETPPAEEAAPANTLRVPDLEGRTIVAVTGNDYTPLNFVDPVTGKSVGWEYDAVNEICRRLHCKVE